MSTGTTHVSVQRLVFDWPDGTRVFDGLDLAIGPGRTGLIGLNGSGKSTLLRLIAGELTPTAGTVRVAGEVGVLAQSVTLDTTQPVDRLLGIAEARAALHAIEAGDASEAHFAAVGDDWDVEGRTRAVLDQLGLSHIGLDTTVGRVSGGETVLLRLAALLLRRPDVLLLDEPTNNLDLRARERLYAAVAAWRGVLVVVSHDRELLERVDQIADPREGRVVRFGGPLSAYQEALAVEQEAAVRTARSAEADVRRQKRDLVEAHDKLAGRARAGRRAAETAGLPKIVAGARKRAAEVSAGKHRILHEERLAEARERLTEAEAAVRDDDEIRVDLPHTAVPNRRQVLTLRKLALRNGATAHLQVLGPERIGLIGPNGAGKTTLLNTIAGRLAPASGEAEVHVPLRYLPQRLDILDGGLSIARNVAALAPTAHPQRVRAQLARFLFRKELPDQRVDTLSGGERFRATLAALMLAEPAPQLLLLDEPTNNLDLASVRQLTSALASYRGALLVASHDLPFLRELGLTRWLALTEGEVTETAPGGADPGPAEAG
ncbi:ATP-binding cassette domain-containing protein [Streptomyces sp. 3MP-14]|uniref:ATP-binding cassette domain-containing protein n=1 Tax=Streptomyces mimosae TaxID=2586635 RepID=A0A5N6AF85_9ACTN|nr:MULTISPECIES: ATP-binding cassette domain-containing protein [Streptomyces]KAB8166480.1 ATP-binding cassette domain-containing protein [Streptomyces mimosae]KAB8178909.1 ATP-binding cassette domain-containing protein [Streptomyces sp. 3MP-14]